MATPRSKLIDPHTPLAYHLVSRCVRGSFLCGTNRLTGRHFAHRRKWLEQRLLALAPHFAIDVYAWAIMANHFHLVVFFDPQAHKQWSNDEVAYRWLEVCPPRINGKVDDRIKAERHQQLLNDPNRLDYCRAQLGSLSTFMQRLKQPIAVRANAEDQVTGHFFEQRFYSGAILDEEALLTTLAYVDLNPVRARLARSIEACADTSIAQRLVHLKVTEDAIHDYLAPLAQGLNRSDRPLAVTLKAYVAHLRSLLPASQPARQSSRRSHLPDAVKTWQARVAQLHEQQRAYGNQTALSAWLTQRRMRPLELPLPG